MADHHHHHHHLHQHQHQHQHHHHHQGKAPINSSQAPGHSLVPKDKVVRTTSYKDYARLGESKHKHSEHTVAVSASALTQKHQIKKLQIETHHQLEKRVIERHVMEKRVIGKQVIEKRVIEKNVIEKHAYRHRIKQEVAVASRAHAIVQLHEKKAHKPKELTSGKKHGHHLF